MRALADALGLEGEVTRRPGWTVSDGDGDPRGRTRAAARHVVVQPRRARRRGRPAPGSSSGSAAVRRRRRRQCTTSSTRRRCCRARPTGRLRHRAPRPSTCDSRATAPAPTASTPGLRGVVATARTRAPTSSRRARRPTSPPSDEARAIALDLLAATGVDLTGAEVDGRRSATTPGTSTVEPLDRRRAVRAGGRRDGRVRRHGQRWHRQPRPWPSPRRLPPARHPRHDRPGQQPRRLGRRPGRRQRHGRRDEQRRCRDRHHRPRASADVQVQADGVEICEAPPTAVATARRAVATDTRRRFPCTCPSAPRRWPGRRGVRTRRRPSTARRTGSGPRARAVARAPPSRSCWWTPCPSLCSSRPSTGAPTSTWCPAYRFTDADGGRVDLPAVADSTLTTPPTTDTSAVDPGEPPVVTVPDTGALRAPRRGRRQRHHPHRSSPTPIARPATRSAPRWRGARRSASATTSTWTLECGHCTFVELGGWFWSSDRRRRGRRLDRLGERHRGRHASRSRRRPRHEFVGDAGGDARWRRFAPLRGLPTDVVCAPDLRLTSPRT